MKKNKKQVTLPIPPQEGGGIPTSCYIILIIIFIIIVYLVVLRQRIDEFFTGTNNTIENTSNENTSNENIKKEDINHLYVVKDVNPFEVQKIWQGKLPDSSKYLSFWQRKNKKSLDQYSIGQFAMIRKHELDIPSDTKIKNTPILNMLVKGGKYPIKYVKLWSSDMIKGTKINTDLSIWQPIPPDGYIAMGDIAVPSLSPPPRSKIVCLPKEELTKNEQIKHNIIQHKGKEADKMSIWTVGNYGSFMVSQSEYKPESRLSEIMDISESLLTKREYDPEETYKGLHVTLSTSKLIQKNNNSNTTL